MSEVDISDSLPNGDDDDSAFPDDTETAVNNDGVGDHDQLSSTRTSVGEGVSVSVHSHSSVSSSGCPGSGVGPHHPPGVVTNHQGTIPADQVFVATSQGLLTAEQLQEAGIKTTHIVIHDQTLNVGGEGEDEGLEEEGQEEDEEQEEQDQHQHHHQHHHNPNNIHHLKQPKLDLEDQEEDQEDLQDEEDEDHSLLLQQQKGCFKYQWDDSVHCTILPVRCKNSNGELNKNKFGSGGRGKCIKSANVWYSPNEFEAFSGRASSKDWKRSIRYGGRTLQCLIEDGLLRPHATSCTCAACCDDESVTGPIRLFVPYKRRKRDSESGPPSPTLKKQRPGCPKSPSLVPSGMSKEVVVTLPSGQALSRPLSVNNGENGETVHIVTTDAQGNFVAGDAVVMTSLANASKTSVTNVLTMDVSEQKYWWQLEEMANTLVQQSQQLKSMIEQAKHQSLVAKETALQQLKIQMEKEKHEALNTARIENHMSLQRTLMEERAQKDIAVQSALAQARAEMQDNSVTLVSSDKVTYAVAWTHQNSQGHIDSIIDGDVEEEMDKDKD